MGDVVELRRLRTYREMSEEEQEEFGERLEAAHIRWSDALHRKDRLDRPFLYVHEFNRTLKPLTTSKRQDRLNELIEATIEERRAYAEYFQLREQWLAAQSEQLAERGQP